MATYKQPESILIDKALVKRLIQPLKHIVESMEPYIENAHMKTGCIFRHGKEVYIGRREFEMRYDENHTPPDFPPQVVDPKEMFQWMKLRLTKLQNLCVENNKPHEKVAIDSKELHRVKALATTISRQSFKHGRFKFMHGHINSSIRELNGKMTASFQRMKGLYPARINLKISLDVVFDAATQEKKPDGRTKLQSIVDCKPSPELLKPHPQKTPAQFGFAFMENPDLKSGKSGYMPPSKRLIFPAGR